MQGHRQTSHSRSWKPLSLKNARSFLIKLVHLHPTAPHKADEPPQDDQTPPDELPQDGAQDVQINSLPPTYDVAVRTLSHLPGHRQAADLSDDLQHSLRSSTIISRSVVMADTSCPSSSASSSTHLPLSTIQPTSLLPSPHDHEEIEAVESLEDQTLLRPSSSRQSCSSINPRPSKRAMTHKSMKASSISTLDSYRNNARSAARRDRELIAAKKSLPILTKFGKSTTTHKNTPLL